MYKTVLLTVNEINLIRKVVADHLDKNMIYMNDKEQRNLHLINRTLLGSIPTKSLN